MDLPNKGEQPVQAQLGLWDAVSIIIGIIIGATIYETPWLIYQNVSGPSMAMGVWVLGGALSLIGAFCYAELATTYPRLGGDYVYLTRAYGSWAGFLFGWAQLTVIHTGGIGMLAYIFADYAHRLWNVGEHLKFVYAFLAVAILSVLNIIGVVFGKTTQNVLTGAKIVGLGGILAAGFLWPQAPRDYFSGKVVQASSEQLVIDTDGKEHKFTVAEGLKLPRPGDSVRVAVLQTEPEKAIQVRGPAGTPSFGFAMVLVFLAFSGYNDAAYVAAEVRNQRRNMPLALILGVSLVTVIYLAINLAYITGLGFEEARNSHEIAADVLRLPLGRAGETVMCLLVMVSALGAVNGSILTGSRVFSSMGADHVIFAWLGRWHPLFRTPFWALVLQAAVSLTMIVAVGTTMGHEQLNRFFTFFGLKPGSWEGRGGFDTLLKFTTPIFWLFFLLTSLSVFVLREMDRTRERPFRVPFYPVLPLIFVASCIYMLHSGINYAGELGLVGVALLVVGLVLFTISQATRPARHAADDGPAGAMPPAGVEEHITTRPNV